MKTYQKPESKSAYTLLKMGIMQIEEAETTTVQLGSGTVPPEDALAPKTKNLWEDDEVAE